ncbi:MAG: type II secretion system F family protein [Verrucomicrobia bacterium]|nr:type II secretion system F family protein [Verrucomicrobiota bacterium]
MDNRQLEQWLGGLAELLSAGLPIIDAVRLLVGDAGARDWRCRFLQQIQQGELLSELLRSALGTRLPDVQAVVAIGERTGKLAESLDRAARLMRNRREFQARLLKSMAYPFLLLAVATAVLSILLFWLLPQLELLQAGAGAGASVLPHTLLLVREHAYVFPLILMAVVPVGFFLWRLEKKGRIRIPVWSRWIGEHRQSQQCCLLGSLLESGLSFDVAYRLLTQMEVMQNCEWQRLQARLAEGWSFAEAIHAEPGLDPLVKSMVAVGEYSGQLPEHLMRVGELLGQRFRTRMDTAVAIFEPTLILGMACLVGGIGWMVLRPLLNFQF